MSSIGASLRDEIARRSRSKKYPQILVAAMHLTVTQVTDKLATLLVR